MASRERASKKELISYKRNVVGKHPWHLHWINFNCGLSYSCTKPHTHICLLCRERPAREICTRNKYISLSICILYMYMYIHTHAHMRVAWNTIFTSGSLESQETQRQSICLLIPIFLVFCSLPKLSSSWC